MRYIVQGRVGQWPVYLMRVPNTEDPRGFGWSHEKTDAAKFDSRADAGALAQSYPPAIVVEWKP